MRREEKQILCENHIFPSMVVFLSANNNIFIYDYQTVIQLCTVATTLNRKSVCEKSFKTYLLCWNLIIISSDVWGVESTLFFKRFNLNSLLFEISFRTKFEEEIGFKLYGIVVAEEVASISSLLLYTAHISNTYRNA